MAGTAHDAETPATTVGLRELRQDASGIVRRVEDGEQIEITVAGRRAALLTPLPASPRRWNSWSDVADVFAPPADSDWQADRDLIDQSLTNPWELPPPEPQ